MPGDAEAAGAVAGMIELSGTKSIEQLPETKVEALVKIIETLTRRREKITDAIQQLKASLRDEIARVENGR
jgi:chaperonin cofactor prefoldin